MENKSDVEKIRFAMELRRRGYSVDLDTNKDDEFFRGCHSAILEFLRKLQDMKYINDYIEMKSKYMSEKERKEWLSIGL